MNWLPLMLGFFLAGSIPFSFLMVRLRTGSDLRTTGSGNPGATNALRIAGPWVGLLGLTLDLAKGFVPVWLGREAGLPDELLAAGAVLCVLGHMYSPFLAFRGGKGVATGCGALCALNPPAVAVSLIVFLVALAISKIVSLSSILAVASLPAVWILPERFGPVPAAGNLGWLAAAVICGVVVLRHGSNLRRLRAGIEPRLGEEFE